MTSPILALSLATPSLAQVDLVDRLTSGGNMLWVMIATISIVGILAGAVTKVVASITRERSRREIAAYIAEGSMTAEQGERLMTAGRGDA
jgi:hypothetical protein